MLSAGGKTGRDGQVGMRGGWMGKGGCVLGCIINTALSLFRRGPDKGGFSLGKSANLQEVFGDDWKVLIFFKHYFKP